MKSLVTLQLAVLEDLGLFLDTDVTRDRLTVLSRVEHEGESFLTITMPNLAKALEKGLRDGVWPRHDFTSMKYVKGLPAFMRGFLTRVFSENGAILDDPDVNAIWAVRQFCNLSGKMDRRTTPERERAALASFVHTDRRLGDHFKQGIPAIKWNVFKQHAFSLFGELFNELETLVANFELLPKHGPGAVADRLSHPQRWEFPYWTERLEEVFPRWRYSRNLPYWTDASAVPMEQEIPVRVITVPKTQAKPRIIAIEPSAMQYAQQGLKREMYRLVKSSSLAGILDFTDQTRNQTMARLGSISGALATLDLSEASDRVHVDVVHHLFERWPHLRDFVFATRSRTADVQGEIIHLEKFASMGSALTFPLEAMIFTVIASMGMSGDGSPTPTRELHGSLSVYGDDIIVPTDAVSDVIDNLELFGFKVNGHKSFWTGWFRESCGEEFYRGHSVSTVKLRADVPTSRRDAALTRRFTDFRNRCFRAGLWRTVKAADEFLSEFISIPPRHVVEQIAAPANVLALDSAVRPAWRGSYDPDLQIWKTRYPSVKADPSPYKVDGESGLLKWFHENHEVDFHHQRDIHESQERAHTFRIKWAGIESLPKGSMGLTTRGMNLN